MLSNFQLNFQVREGDGLMWVPKKPLGFLFYLNFIFLYSKLGRSFQHLLTCRLVLYKTLFQHGIQSGTP